MDRSRWWRTTPPLAGATAFRSGSATLTGQAAIAFHDNGGDLGKVFDELGSSQSIRNIATAMATAGALEGLSVADLLPANLAYANASSPFVDQLQRQLIDGAGSALIRSAINGTSLEDEFSHALTTAFVNALAAQGAGAIGANTAPGSAINLIAHAIVGCAAGAMRADSSGGCAAGSVGAVVGEMTALALNGNRSAEDIIANGLRPGTLETVALMSGLAAAMAGGNASEMALGVNAGVNAAQNNQAAQLMVLAQAAARFGQVGWSGLTAEAQVVLARCAAATWCASLPLAGAAVAYVGSAQFVGVQPTGAGAIPNGYGSGQPLPPGRPTVLPVTGAEGANTTTTPGTVVTGGGAPGYESPPFEDNTSTSSTNGPPRGVGPLALSENSYEPSPKHAEGGWGTPMDLPSEIAQRVLDASVLAGRQRYGYYEGRLYEFQDDNAGGWHGYPIPGNEAPVSILRGLRDNGVISNFEYNQMIKGK